MKQKITLFKVFLTLVLLCGVGNAWGESYTLTPDNATTGNTATAYVTSAYSFTYNEVSWSFNQWNPSTLQIKTNQSSGGNEFNFKNTSAFPGRITKVVITFSALTVSDASKLCFVGGKSTISSLSGGTAGTWNSTAKTLTWTPSETDEFTYFAFYQNGKAASGTNKLASANAIVVTYEGPVKTPTITPSGGSFVNSVDAKITCATEGATIYYTTDGTDPTDDSSVYSAPFNVTETTTIKAVAYKDGEHSSVATATYTKIPQLTISEFIAAEVSGNLYVLEGKIIDITNTEYGNLTIKDSTGEVYVNGLRENSTAANNTFANLNLKLGDVVKIVGKRGEYNNEVQVLDAFYNRHYTPEKENYTVTYNSLGVQLSSETVQEFETAAAIPSPVTPPTGWTFAGWTTDNSYQSSISAPTMFDVNSPIKANTNLYAVFKKDSGIGTSVWRLVTDAGSLAAGDKITFAATKDNKSYASGVFEDKFLSSVTASISDEILTSEEAIEITLGGTSDSWTLTISEGKIGTTAAKTLSLDVPTAWSISIDDNSKATVLAGDYGKILYNVGSPRFLNYTSEPNVSMLLPYIFRKESVSYTIYTLNVPLTQNVTITPACYATACIPFNATVEGATAYYVTVSGNKAQLNEIEGTIPAETGVVLKGSAGTVTFTESAVTPTTDVSENKMVGSLVVKTFKKEGFVYYRLANKEGNVGFYQYDEDGSAECDAGKAVLEVPVTAAPSFFTFDDATAINAISNVKTSSVRYNLNGQAVGEDYKGIVIVNGKKMFNK